MKQLIIITILAIGLLNSANGQTYATLEKVLTDKLSETATKDGRWVFHSDKANIEKVDKPLVKAVIPGYDFYKVTLTHYLGEQINEATCVILYDSAGSGIILVEPLWYGGISKPLVKLIIKKPFDSKEQIPGFLDQLNDLMGMGSGCTFIRTGATNELITYDLLNFNGSAHATGNRANSAGYNKDEVWKQIKIEINDRQVIRYTSIDPKANKKETIK